MEVRNFKKQHKMVLLFTFITKNNNTIVRNKRIVYNNTVYSYCCFHYVNIFKCLHIITIKDVTCFMKLTIYCLL